MDSWRRLAAFYMIAFWRWRGNTREKAFQITLECWEDSQGVG